jgi:DNA polymerase III delta prime subunit
MAEKKKNEVRDLDYAVLGSGMARIKRVVVRTFIGALKRGKFPHALMIQGPPGCGKTFTVYSAAQAISKFLNIDDPIRACTAKSLLIACMDPVDVNGFPQKHPEHPFAEYYPLRWAWEASQEYEQAERDRRGDPKWTAPPMIIFFDDLPVAHQQTQAAFFKVVHEGMVGDLTLRKNVMIIAAGNRVEDNAAAQDMPTALGNRFRWIYAQPTHQDWIEWAVREGGIHPAVVGYLRKNEADLFDFNEEKANSEEKAFATPRSWENLSDALFEDELFEDRDPEFMKTTAGIIGRGLASMFHAFLRTAMSAVPASEIVKNPKKAPVPKKQHLDLLHATVASLEHHIRENPKTYQAGLVYACREEMPADMAILLAKSITDLIWTWPDEAARNEAFASKEYEIMFDRYGEHITGVSF